MASSTESSTNKTTPPNERKYLSKLNGTTILILGGTSGMGFCVAECVIEHGASVIISGANPDNLQSALKRLRNNYPSTAASKISGYTCDLSQPSQLESNITSLLRSCTPNDRKIDHIVFSAGNRLKLTPITEATAAEIQAAGVVRFLAPLILAKLAPAYMSLGPGSSIVLTGGTMAAKPLEGWSIFAAWGAGVEGMTRGLAQDLKPIRVNCIAPGAVHTEMFANFPPDQLDAVLERFRAETLMGEVGRPESVAEAYVYCLKDRFLTGTVISPDGGRLLK